MNQSGTTHTFRSMRGPHLVAGIVAMVAGVGILAGDAAALAYPSSSWATGSGGVSKWGDFWLAVGGLFLIWVGIRLLRVGIQVSGGKMTVRGYFRTRTVDASEIRAITLQPHSGGEARPAWVPRVELTGGKSFHIVSFPCGAADRPPKAARAAAVDEIRTLLGIKTDEVRKLGNGQAEAAAF